MTYRPTSIDVAALAGVSQSTVSRVFNGSAQVSAQVRRQVMDAAQKLRYRVDAHASQLRSGRVRNLEVVVVEDVGNEYGTINPFFVPMIGEIVRYGGEKGYDVAISFQKPAGDETYTMALRPAEGTIFLAPKEFETYVRNTHGPDHTAENWVVWGRYATDHNTSCVVSDNERGAFDAVTHLIRQGRRRIAYFGKFSGEQWEFTERQHGYGEALRQAGLPLDDRLQIDCVLTSEGGAAAVERLLAGGVAFDAIFAATDVLGISALRALAAHDLSVPDQVAVIGFDDLWICNTVTPRLSTVRQDTMRAARLLVDSVEALIEGAPVSTTKIPTELVIRESCGAAGSQGRAGR